MTNYAIVTIPSIEEGHIDRHRIIDGDRVPNEYFCPICQYLLWKPRSCSTCQHLFCEKCIYTWIEYENNGKKCPFRCKPFEDRQCPRFVQLLLSNLNIHCRNSKFGCEKFVSYDQLEHHENVECQYLTKQCSKCDKLVLLSKFVEHEETPGLCIPCPIKCIICHNSIEKCYFREHFYECCRKRINEFIEKRSSDQNLSRTTNDQNDPPNNELRFFQPKTNSMNLFERQNQMCQFSTSLKGVDAVRRSREHKSGYFSDILITIKFILLNWPKIPFFLFVFSTIGFFDILILFIAVYIYFSHWIITHNYYGPIFVILLSFISTYGTLIVIQFVPDKILIIFFGSFIFVIGCSNRISLEVLEFDFLFNRRILSIIFCFIGILIMKIILLLIRLYYWSLSIYVATSFITFINFYVAFKIHRVYGYTLAIITNQRTLTV